MSLVLNGDSPNITGATLTTPTLTSPTFAGTPTGSIITSGTAVASTSGTSIDFTGIPSWAKRITVMFNAVSTSGTSISMIQLGSTTFTTTGYNSVASSVGTTGTNTTGFILSFDQAANYVRYGSVQLSNITGNQWVISGVTGDNGSGGATTRMFLCAGSVSLSGVLDRIRITTVNGTDTYDAGTINILYE